MLPRVLQGGAQCFQCPYKKYKKHVEERNGWTGRRNEKLWVISITTGGITAESEGEDWMCVLQSNRDDLPEISLLPFKPQACKESTVAFSVCLSSILLLFVVAVLYCLLLNKGGITMERSICNCLCDGFICTFGKVWMPLGKMSCFPCRKPARIRAAYSVLL